MPAAVDGEVPEVGEGVVGGGEGAGAVLRKG